MLEPKFKINTEKETADYGKFILEPFYTGFAYTIGHQLRRVLLSSLSGAAVTAVEIEGVKHQFQTLEGLREEIVDFILNLKKLRIKLFDVKKTELTLTVKGSGKITAQQIECPTEAEIANKDLYLGALADKNAKMNAKILVEQGYGYQLASERPTEKIGIIPVDANFTPVVRVNYKVEATRVGRMMNYDRLILEIWTDGTIVPSEAMKQSAKLLVSYFMQIYEPKEVAEEVMSVSISPAISEEILKASLEEMDLPLRMHNALIKAGITTIGQLLGTPRKDLLKIKNFGAKSLEGVEEKLREKGIVLSI